MLAVACMTVCAAFAQNTIRVSTEKDRSCPEGLAQGETLSSVSGRQIA